MNFVKSKMIYSANKDVKINNYFLIGIIVIILITLGVVIFDILKKKEKYEYIPPKNCKDASKKLQKLIKYGIDMGDENLTVDDQDRVKFYMSQNNCYGDSNDFL